MTSPNDLLEKAEKTAQVPLTVLQKEFVLRVLNKLREREQKLSSSRKSFSLITKHKQTKDLYETFTTLFNDFLTKKITPLRFLDTFYKKENELSDNAETGNSELVYLLKDFKTYISKSNLTPSNFTTVQDLNAVLTVMLSTSASKISRQDFKRNYDEISEAAKKMQLNESLPEFKDYQQNWEKAGRRLGSLAQMSSATKDSALASLSITQARLQHPLQKEMVAHFIKIAHKDALEEIIATDQFLRGEISHEIYLKKVSSALGHPSLQKQCCGALMMIIGLASLMVLLSFASTTFAGLALFGLGALSGLIIIGGGILIDINREQTGSTAQAMRCIGEHSLFEYKPITPILDENCTFVPEPR